MKLIEEITKEEAIVWLKSKNIECVYIGDITMPLDSKFDLDFFELRDGTNLIEAINGKKFNLEECVD